MLQYVFWYMMTGLISHIGYRSRLIYLNMKQCKLRYFLKKNRIIYECYRMINLGHKWINVNLKSMPSLPNWFLLSFLFSNQNICMDFLFPVCILHSPLISSFLYETIQNYKCFLPLTCVSSWGSRLFRLFSSGCTRNAGALLFTFCWRWLCLMMAQCEGVWYRCFYRICRCLTL